MHGLKKRKMKWEQSYSGIPSTDTEKRLGIEMEPLDNKRFRLAKSWQTQGIELKKTMRRSGRLS